LLHDSSKLSKIEDTPEDEEEAKSQPKVSFQVQDEKKVSQMRSDVKRKSAIPFKRQVTVINTYEALDDIDIAQISF